MAIFPSVFLDRLRQILPLMAYDKVLDSFEKPRAITFRLNRLKADAVMVLKELEEQGFSAEPVVWYDAAYVLSRGTLRGLQETRVYQQGEIYLQELSSMVPALLLDPQPGENVLDMTAAPGSKTTQMAAHMKNSGTLTANDASRARFFKLKANLEWQGVKTAVLSNKPGESFGRRMPEHFARILLDAPCSGEGRFHALEPESFEGWKLSKIKSLVPRQKMLFYSAFGALKPGGTLVYSTCTFAPEENEGILDWALEKFSDRMTIEKIRLPLANQTDGLAAWGKKTYRSEVQNALRILPDETMEGFFVARITKAGPKTLFAT